jgi:hypothetical protein
MKMFLRSLLVLLCPLMLLAEEAPKKQTLEAYRIFAKDGHDAALRAALAAHAAKYHTGNWKWRVSDVLTGPDSGSLMITEGPNSWTDLETRGDLGAEHQKDYETTILPHVERTTPDAYETYEPDLSSVPPGAFANTKTLISHIFPKPGRGAQEADLLKHWKKVWEKRGINVGVWVSFFSGEQQFTVVYRLKDGWKDIDMAGPSNRAAADEIYGPGGFDRMMEQTERNVARSYGEMIEFKPELSSK